LNAHVLTDREAGFFIIATPVAWALGTWLWPEHTSLPGVLFGALALGWLWSQRPRSSAS
jgi:hypothetical protein